MAFIVQRLTCSVAGRVGKPVISALEEAGGAGGGGVDGVPTVVATTAVVLGSTIALGGYGRRRLNRG